MIPSFSRWRRRMDAGRKDEWLGSLFGRANTEARVGEVHPQAVRMAMIEASPLGECLARFALSGRSSLLPGKLFRPTAPPAQYGGA